MYTTHHIFVCSHYVDHLYVCANKKYTSFAQFFFFLERVVLTTFQYWILSKRYCSRDSFPIWKHVFSSSFQRNIQNAKQGPNIVADVFFNYKLKSSTELEMQIDLFGLHLDFLDKKFFIFFLVSMIFPKWITDSYIPVFLTWIKIQVTAILNLVKNSIESDP